MVMPPNAGFPVTPRLATLIASFPISRRGIPIPTTSSADITGCLIAPRDSTPRIFEMVPFPPPVAAWVRPSRSTRRAVPLWRTEPPPSTPARPSSCSSLVDPISGSNVIGSLHRAESDYHRVVLFATHRNRPPPTLDGGGVPPVPQHVLHALLDPPPVDGEDVPLRLEAFGRREGRVEGYDGNPLLFEEGGCGFGDGFGENSVHTSPVRAAISAIEGPLFKEARCNSARYRWAMSAMNFWSLAFT